MYRCNHCKSIHTDSEWNAATIVRYGRDIVFIGDKGDMENSSFQCPGCGALSEGAELTKVNRRPKVTGREADHG